MNKLNKALARKLEDALKIIDDVMCELEQEGYDEETDNWYVLDKDRDTYTLLHDAFDGLVNIQHKLRA